MKFDRQDNTVKQRLQNQAYDLEKVLKGSLALFPTKESVEAIKTSVNAYILSMVGHLTGGNVNPMSLSEGKLAALYDIPVTEAMTLVDYINDSIFKEAVKYTDKGLVLDTEKASKIIEGNATITLTKAQNDFLKQLEKVEKEYVKLFNYTQNPDGLFQVNHRERQFFPNVAMIKHLVN